jgi:divalent metal cation (Fe/Co/Zn/Cd) transporter
VEKVESVRARWVGHTVYAEVEIGVDPALSVEQGNQIARNVKQSLKEHVRLLGEAVVTIRPASGQA